MAILNGNSIHDARFSLHLRKHVYNVALLRVAAIPHPVFVVRGRP